MRALEEEIQDLKRLLNQQQERLAAVEAGVKAAPELLEEAPNEPPPASDPLAPARQIQAGAGHASTDAAPAVEDPSSSSAYVREPAAAAPMPVDFENEPGSETHRGVDLTGYYDARFFDNTQPSSHGSFQQHAISLFFGKALGRWTFHSEIEFESAFDFDADGGEFVESRGDLHLATAWLNYGYSDLLQTRIGYIFFPTYWRLHHSPALALTVNDPLIDTRIFPSAFTGIMTHGSKYYRDGGITYALLMGNGRGPNQGHEDVNDHKATGAKLLVHIPNGNFFRVLDLGILQYRDKLENRDRESIHGLEARAEKGRLSFVGEYARANIKHDNGPRKFFREGFYLQPWVRVARRLSVVYRYDSLDLDSRFARLQDASRHTIGLNYRPRPQVSLKLDFNRDALAGTSQPPFHGVAAGIALFFQ